MKSCSHHRIHWQRFTTKKKQLTKLGIEYITGKAEAMMVQANLQKENKVQAVQGMLPLCYILTLLSSVDVKCKNSYEV